MSKKERQAYRRGMIEAMVTIAVLGFYTVVFIGFMMR